MIALGLICLLIAAALVIVAIVGGTSQDVTLTSTVGDFTTQPVWVFVAGALAMLLLLVGLSILRRGARRRNAQRREIKRLRRENEGLAETEASRQDRATPTTPDPPAAADGPVSSSSSAYDEPDRRLVREPRDESDKR